eukprot:5285769-Amphidinium_carterae.1
MVPLWCSKTHVKLAKRRGMQQKQCSNLLFDTLIRKLYHAEERAKDGGMITVARVVRRVAVKSYLLQITESQLMRHALPWQAR